MSEALSIFKVWRQVLGERCGVKRAPLLLPVNNDIAVLGVQAGSAQTLRGVGIWVDKGADQVKTFQNGR